MESVIAAKPVNVVSGRRTGGGVMIDNRIQLAAQEIANLLDLCDETRDGVTAIISKHIGDTWIPVSERLPEPHTAVLGYTRGDDGYHLTHLNHKGEWWTNKAVTHWRPLPVAPEEGK
jgi:hypothetical protein